MKTNKIWLAFLLLLAWSANAQKKIRPTELPKDALTFIEKHFPGRAIHTAKKDWEHGEKGFEVILSDNTEIQFWKDGKYREIDGRNKPIPTDFVDPKIIDYVNKNYPGKQLTHIDYGHKDVDVDLTGKIDLEFTKDGKFLKCDKK